MFDNELQQHLLEGRGRKWMGPGDTGHPQHPIAMKARVPGRMPHGWDPGITGMTELWGPRYLGTAQDLQESTLQLQKGLKNYVLFGKRKPLLYEIRWQHSLSFAQLHVKTTIVLA